ncbi:MAG: hypothetical protein ACOC4B_00830 [Bacteroidota bacterium]
MTTEKLRELIQNQKFSELKKFFESFDQRSNSINDWQIFLNMELNPWSCDLAHKFRNSLMSALSYFYGVEHLNKTKYPEIAKSRLKDALNYLNFILNIRGELNIIHNKIHKVLY